MRKKLGFYFKLLFVGLLVTSCASESYKELGSYNSYTLINESLSACHNKAISTGKQTLEKVMNNEKNNPLYWNALGVCYSLTNQKTKATYYFELGLEAVESYKADDKKQIEAALYNNLGLIQLSYNKYNDAYFYFKKAETIAPDLYNIQLNLSQLFLQFNYDDRALAILYKLESLRPGDTEVLYSLALIYARKNDYEKALVTLSKINAEEISRPDISGLFAYNLLRTNQLNEAESIMQKRRNNELYQDYNARNKNLVSEIEAKLKEQSVALKK
jgi:tetratricopeptide (TPR) repeat protein